MGSFAAFPQFRAHGFKDGILGRQESLKIETVIQWLARDSASVFKDGLYCSKDVRLKEQDVKE